MEQLVLLIFVGMLIRCLKEIKCINYLIILIRLVIWKIIIIWRERMYIKLRWSMGLDRIRVLLIILRIWLIFIRLVVVKSDRIKTINYFILITLGRILILRFRIVNILFFFIYFEMRLVPIIYMINVEGIQIERFKAGVYILLLTIIGSLPLLIILMLKRKRIRIIIKNREIIWEEGIIIIVLFIAFFIKLPIYIVHIWLPKAHVEAPVVGSMLLAGILLKLGGYGIYRIMFIVIGIKRIIVIIIIWRIIGALTIRVICLNQIDLKILVAYSSVCHIRYVVGRFLSGFKLGERRGLLIIVGHGICSRSIFFRVNLLYKRYLTRNIILLKGIQNLFPFFRLLWFFICVINLGVPLTINFISEVISIVSIVTWRRLILLPIIRISFIRAFYSLYIYIRVQYGKIVLYKGRESVKIVEYTIIIIHLLIVILYILKVERFTI